jgi:aspartate carbamoyltransferase
MIGLKRQKTYDVVPTHLLTVRGLSLDFVQQILVSAQQMKELVATKGGDDRLKHKILATAFFEPSTRTSCSFQAAMLRLGGSVITFTTESSSVKKGETLEDTIQTLACYCDAIALRHPLKGSANTAANVSSKPIINAGDGTGEHPTQALLDLFTIRSELGGIGGQSPDAPMVITLLGDLKHGRTVHSLVVLLSMFSNINLVYISPEGLGMPEDILQEVKERGIQHQVFYYLLNRLLILFLLISQISNLTLEEVNSE